MAKQDDYVRYTIRVPKEVFQPLERAAHSENRSVNAEIIERLNATIINPAQTVENLTQKVASLENEIEITRTALKYANEKIDQLISELEVNRLLFKEINDSSIYSLYFILSYVDKIPFELALYAHQRIAHNRKAYGFSPETIEEMKKQYELYKKHSLGRIKREIKFLEDEYRGEDDTTDETAPD